MAGLALTTKLDARDILVGGLHIELDRAVSKHEAVKSNRATFKNDGPLRKALVAYKGNVSLIGVVRILHRVPVVCGERNLDGRGGMQALGGKREQQSSGAKMTCVGDRTSPKRG